MANCLPGSHIDNQQSSALHGRFCFVASTDTSAALPLLRSGSRSSHQRCAGSRRWFAATAATRCSVSRRLVFAKSSQRPRPKGVAFPVRRTDAARPLRDERDHRAADRGVIAIDGERSCGPPNRCDHYATQNREGHPSRAIAFAAIRSPNWRRVSPQTPAGCVGSAPSGHVLMSPAIGDRRDSAGPAGNWRLPSVG